MYNYVFIICFWYLKSIIVLKIKVHAPFVDAFSGYEIEYNFFHIMDKHTC